MKPFISCAAIFSLIASPIQAQRTVHGVVVSNLWMFASWTTTIVPQVGLFYVVLRAK